MAHIGPAYGGALQSALPELLVQLEAEAAASAPAEPEPDLATPRADGPLAGLA